MPLTVITLKKVPPSLRGDLSKWMQEIATGVYVGNFNTKIRAQLWERVVQSSSTGEATMSYAIQNEIGYHFETLNAQRQVVEYDGIPLVALPKINQVIEENEHKKGYSNAAKFRKAKKFAPKAKGPIESLNYVVIDIETDGLNYKENQIIEIGAVKAEGDKISHFQRLIEYEKNIPAEITKLTGITQKLLEKEGISMERGLKEFIDFIEDFDLVGFEVDFDLRFLNRTLSESNMQILTNKVFDLNKFVKREKINLKNYKLDTVLSAYKIGDRVPHRALADAKLIYQLSTKVNKFLKIINKE
ncbi:type I-E CRISPR-associated endoribonuclease Cas2e [Proteinivorax tanatarense]|uniref:Type I-E CRISPR-associated endoribonuclease Cas2e n=1 Tax=Proteinivorax tanatarense TaxID=1260629 RepID=A0AAU7VK80_9FIRM